MQHAMQHVRWGVGGTIFSPGRRRTIERLDGAGMAPGPCWQGSAKTLSNKPRCAGFRPLVVEVGQSNPGRIQPKSARFGSNPGESCPTSPLIWPKPTEIRRVRANLPNPTQAWPKVDKAGEMSVNFCPNNTNVDPDSIEIDSTISAEAHTILAHAGRHHEKLHAPGPSRWRAFSPAPTYHNGRPGLGR